MNLLYNNLGKPFIIFNWWGLPPAPHSRTRFHSFCWAPIPCIKPGKMMIHNSTTFSNLFPDWILGSFQKNFWHYHDWNWRSNYAKTVWFTRCHSRFFSVIFLRDPFLLLVSYYSINTYVPISVYFQLSQTDFRVNKAPRNRFGLACFEMLIRLFITS